MEIFFKTKTNQRPKQVLLSTYDFEEPIQISRLNPVKTAIIHPVFEKYTVARNEWLLNNVFTKLVNLDEIDEELAGDLLIRFDTYLKSY